MPLNLANAGLAMQGANASQADANALQTQKLGLEDLQRTHDTEADIRQVAAQGGSHEDMALAAEKRGDYNRALEHRQHGKALEDESIKNVIHKALIDPTPGNRPDLVAEANRYGKGGGMTAMSLDDKGNLTFAGAKSGMMNVGVAAERMGLVKPYEHVLTPGSTYIRSNPVSGATTTYKAPPADKFQSTRTGTIFDTATGDIKFSPPDESWTLGEIQNGDKKVPVSFNKKNGDAVILGPGGNPEHTQVHTDPTGKTTVTIQGKVFEVSPGTPATPGKSHLFSPDEPATPAKPASLVPVNTDAPPIDGARKAPDGKWYVKSGNGYAEVIPAAGGAPAAAAPAAAPAPVAKPAPAAAPKAVAKRTPPASQGEVRKGEATDDTDLPAISTAGSPKQAHESRVASVRAQQESKRAESKARGLEKDAKTSAENFRAVVESNTMSARDIPVIEQALSGGQLTAAESDKARRMLAKLKPQSATYASGGKVQRYGI